MAQLAQKYKDRLPELKENVKKSYDYFRPNYERFHKFRRFVFDSSITSEERDNLDILQKPVIEFNILESYISRLRGEFSKQEPSVLVSPDDGNPVDPQLLKVVEAHIRHIIFEANQDGLEYKVYTDLLSGGFSTIKVWTEYANPMSMNQIIKIGRVFDPTLVGFDPAARTPCKGDGRYCFELYPRTKEEIERDYPNVDVREISFARNVEGFNWSYQNNDQEVVLLCDYYEKKIKRKQIVQVIGKDPRAPGPVVTMDAYNKFKEEWEKSGTIEQVPGIKGEPRWTNIETICRYIFMENEVISYEETNFDCFPLIFCDGNSIDLKEPGDGSNYQMTRPYVYHAMGAQRLKNFAGQTLANELENMVQHKFMVAKESLPDEAQYLEAYSNIQKPNTLVYKAFDEINPDKPVPPPQPIPRIPPPPEVSGTFNMIESTIQNILGSFDAALGINDNQLSGVAIVEAATQSNAAAMPYVVGFMQAWERVGNVVVRLLPKIYVTPRSIPAKGPDGKMVSIKINQPGGVQFNYDENALSVKVEAGVNFAIQKSKALQQIIGLMQASPSFAQFINEIGLPVLLDNIEIKGIDQLKQMSEMWMQQQQQMKQQAMQMQKEAMQNNPQMLAVQNEKIKIQAKAQDDNVKNQLAAAQLALDKQEQDLTEMKILAEMKQSSEEAQVQMAKADAERSGQAVELAMRVADVSHRHEKEFKELHHKIAKDRVELDQKERAQDHAERQATLSTKTSE